MKKKIKPPLTVSLLKAYMSYDPETGDFIRIKGSRIDKIGVVAQVKNKDGYFQIGFANHCQPAHRMAWLYMTGTMPDGQIDHIDGNPQNNRFINLRVVTNAQNCQNRRSAAKKNKTGVLGVIAMPGGRFVAQIKVDFKSRHLGTFKTIEEAHAAYLIAKRQLHPFGEIAKQGEAA